MVRLGCGPRPIGPMKAKAAELEWECLVAEPEEQANQIDSLAVIIRLLEELSLELPELRQTVNLPEPKLRQVERLGSAMAGQELPRVQARPGQQDSLLGGLVCLQERRLIVRLVSSVTSPRKQAGG